MAAVEVPRECAESRNASARQVTNRWLLGGRGRSSGATASLRCRRVKRRSSLTNASAMCRMEKLQSRPGTSRNPRAQQVPCCTMRLTRDELMALIRCPACRGTITASAELIRLRQLRCLVPSHSWDADSAARSQIALSRKRARRCYGYQDRGKGSASIPAEHKHEFCGRPKL